MTDDVRREAIELLRRLRAEAQRFEQRPGLAGLGRVRLEVFGAAAEALRLRQYYAVPVPAIKDIWLAAIDGAIADLEGRR